MDAIKTIEKMLAALVSPNVPNKQLPALFAGVPGSGDIIDAILAGRAALERAAKKA